MYGDFSSPKRKVEVPRCLATPHAMSPPLPSRGQSTVEFPLLREADSGMSMQDFQKKRTPSTARPFSRGARALIGLPFSVWAGACYWNGVGGSMFNSPSSAEQAFPQHQNSVPPQARLASCVGCAVAACTRGVDGGGLLGVVMARWHDGAVASCGALEVALWPVTAVLVGFGVTARPAPRARSWLRLTTENEGGGRMQKGGARVMRVADAKRAQCATKRREASSKWSGARRHGGGTR